MTFRKTGIIAYGTAIPGQCILASEIERAQGESPGKISTSLGVLQKSVPDLDEDSATLATDASFQAIERSAIDPTQVQALFIGSESHPYAVKPTGTIVKEALGLSDFISLADLQFACKAGTQGMQIGAAYVESGLVQYALAIGSDTAQSRPGDVLEFTAGAGAGAFLLGKKDCIVALHASISVASDTPDFWRRSGRSYPEHAGRFSGEPGYFSHVKKACQTLMEEVGLSPKDITHCVFHTPNGKFPNAIAKSLGFSPRQLQDGLVVENIGNTYSAASLLGLSALLDVCGSGETILLCSYGSGAGADCYLLETTPLLLKSRKKWNSFVREKIRKLESISYEEYRHCTGGRK